MLVTDSGNVNDTDHMYGKPKSLSPAAGLPGLTALVTLLTVLVTLLTTLLKLLMLLHIGVFGLDGFPYKCCTIL